MKNLIIVGAGGFSKEILAWFPQTLDTSSFKFKGFLDDNPALNPLDSIKNYSPQPSDVFVCAIGDPRLKEKVIEILENKNAKFINLIHKTAVVLSDCNSSKGLIVAPFVFISSNVKLGNHVLFNIACSIGHDAKIGGFCSLSPHSVVSGNVSLGEKVLLGSHASIIPGKTIGDNAVVGAGSAVIRNVPEKATVVGVPAKRLL
jgi:sugar O-acyltransferase (sialic acid O-acetyltransferase NeuD family)